MTKLGTTMPISGQGASDCMAAGAVTRTSFACGRVVPTGTHCAIRSQPCPVLIGLWRMPCAVKGVHARATSDLFNRGFLHVSEPSARVANPAMRQEFAETIGAAALKVSPPVTVATAVTAGALRPESLLVWLTIIYTLAMLATFVIKNWATWIGWWERRWVQAGVFWRWLRKPKP